MATPADMLKSVITPILPSTPEAAQAQGGRPPSVTIAPATAPTPPPSWAPHLILGAGAVVVLYLFWRASR